jgi:hypothetical protein
MFTTRWTKRYAIYGQYDTPDLHYYKQTENIKQLRVACTAKRSGVGYCKDA